MVDLHVVGVVLHADENSPLLLLHPDGSEKILVLPIGPMEAIAVSAVLNSAQPRITYDPERGSAENAPIREPAPQPTVYDLALQMLQSTGARLQVVEILRLDNNAHYAEAVLFLGMRMARVACRPADGVALALRCGASIRATEEVLAYAQNMAAVLESLPPHIRALARTSLLTQKLRPEEQRIASLLPDFSKIPLVVEGQGKTGGNADPSSPKPLSAPQAKKSPTIKLSVVHQDKDGRHHLVDEVHISADSPAADGPHVVPAPAAEAYAGTEEERWATLLRVLAPETKTPM